MAPNAIPQTSFVDGKVVAEKVLAALQMDEDNYRIGNTKAFFRAGVVGDLEDMRDDRLTKIFCLLQAWIRGYLNRNNYKNLCSQRLVAYYLMGRLNI